MKLLISLVSLLFAVHAQAEVKLPGTLVSTQCAEATETNSRLGGFRMSKVCTAKIAGSKESYITIEETRILGGGIDTQVTVWQIKTGVENATTAAFDVEEAGYQGESGIFQPKVNTSIVTGKISVKLKAGDSAYQSMSGNLGGRKFTAVNFRYVMHTM